MKIRIALIFGGRSVEHEVSVISALQAMANMDSEKYEIYPVYMTKENEFYYGEKTGDIEAYRQIPSLLSSSERVILINDNKRFYLVNYPSKKFGGNTKIEVDIAFPVVHGTNVEDGTLMGHLKTIGIPFVGCDVTSAAVGMDKYLQKTAFRYNDIPVLDCLRFTLADYSDMDSLAKKTEEKIGYPVIVKPVNSGSSVGIMVADDRNGLIKAVDNAFLFTNTILIEKAVKNLREINCSVLGDAADAKASPCEEPFHTDEILSYEDKYLSGGKGSKGSKETGASGSKGMASLQRKIPADIPDELSERIRELSVKAFKVLDCSGVVRFDFILDEDTKELFLNEINTIPGSLSFYLWEADGMSYKELLDRLIELALKRARDNRRVNFSFETNLLDKASFSGAKK
ncbi:MAG: D-alanine--D-alanine ligase [Lachnospiraceae bacterium]|nr:D-alanine--D-alanine ligase [Lachnospiraceae bacterium]